MGLVARGRERVGAALRRARPVLAWVPCAVFSVIALRWFRAVTGHHVRSAFVAALVWGSLVLASFVGWGTLLERRLSPARPADPALRAAWGMALVVAMGGVLSLLCLISRGRVLAIVAGGLVAVALDLGARRAALLTAFGERCHRLPNELGVTVGIGALAVLALVQAADAGLYQAPYWHCDDTPAYLVFPAEMLSAGCSIQPFSIRGLNGYGGHSFLNAVMMSALPTSWVFLFDRGLCLLVVFGLIAWAPLRRRALALVPLALLVTLPDVRANTTSTMSTVVLFLALFRTVELAPDSEGLPRRTGVLLALLATSMAALRQSCLVPAAATLALLYGAALVRAEPPARRALLREASVVALAALALLAPWALSSFRSARALAHPLFSQNYHAELGAYVANKGHLAFAKRLWENFTYERTIKTLPLFLLAGMLVREQDRRRPTGAVFWGSVIGTLALLWAFVSGDPGDNERLLFSFALVTALAVLLGSLREAEAPVAERSPARLTETFLPAVIACAAVLIQVNEGRAAAGKLYAKALEGITEAKKTPPDFKQPLLEKYQALQSAVPPGEGILAMLDEPFWLDFRRNKVDVIDLVGMVSPRPGLPLETDDAFARYLLDRKLRYFAFVRKESSQELYRASTWTALQKNPKIEPSQKALAPLFFKAFERAESLTRTRRKIYEADAMVVVDLATPAGKP